MILEILPPKVKNDVEPQDLVMETFRINFPLISSCFVSVEDGKTMTYNMKDEMEGNAWAEKAKILIEALNLPLSASVKKLKKRNYKVEFKLCLIYNP